ncbi:MAG: nucleoside hydrolase [Firmicutes bacterium]|nr:nucleoside hydrolase [Bacillota bacterium]
MPVILDTDIGSDIDDALCLTYLLAHPRCDLLGVTTVSGEPEKRAMLADAVCKAAGRDNVPIHAGLGNPLLVPQRQTVAQQGEILDQWPHASDFVSNTAVDFLRETIRSRPHEITLLTIGPLTNIAVLFKLDPEIPSLLKSLVMMAGVFSFPNEHVRYPVEWNMLLDPHAAFIVYDTDCLSKLSVGLDVTTKCCMPREQWGKKLKGGVLDLIRDAAEVWSRQSPIITFHDPLAAAAIFAPHLMEYQTGLIEIELKSSMLKGMTLWDPKISKTNNRIATQVDVKGFFNEYFQTVEGV